MTMLDLIPDPVPSPPSETEAQRQLRIERERVIVANGRADIKAGLATEWPAFEDWLERLDVDENAPAPPMMGCAPRG